MSGLFVAALALGIAGIDPAGLLLALGSLAAGARERTVLIFTAIVVGGGSPALLQHEHLSGRQLLGRSPALSRSSGSTSNGWPTGHPHRRRAPPRYQRGCPKDIVIQCSGQQVERYQPGILGSRDLGRASFSVVPGAPHLQSGPTALSPRANQSGDLVPGNSSVLVGFVD